MTQYLTTVMGALDDHYAMSTVWQSNLLTAAACFMGWTIVNLVLTIIRIQLVVKGALYRIQILCRRYTFWSYPAGLTIADPPG